MRTQNQSSTSILVLLALFLSIQGCGLQQRVALDNFHDHVGAHHANTGINHRDDCPVIDQSRSTFFEENLFESNLTFCPYCKQAKNVNTASVEKTKVIRDDY
ncbi:hypothetical protein [Haliscomenobacter hydrossis]|uniref:Lipoprotein n=1 Tax=Haliscomenobacter hydrossis (strain ATCC 27775 / DSM 1100 / LMG 10767 / O) TaxID=760192 RepID=F4L0P9_HALH1|nr:hypothetical protein [Haliscomenobacter hydrossis]AEE49531.1 hypothetical protein Halhy_1642 [Haliscomenobacter hydrossis DSM 1100]